MARKGSNDAISCQYLICDLSRPDVILDNTQIQCIVSAALSSHPMVHYPSSQSCIAMQAAAPYDEATLPTCITPRVNDDGDLLPTTWITGLPVAGPSIMHTRV